MADYVFIELDSSAVRYEVNCRKCGEHYGEDSRPPVHDPVAVTAEPPILWPRDHEPVPPRDWRMELRGHVDRVNATTIKLRADAAARMGRARVLVAELRLRRAGDQTGG